MHMFHAISKLRCLFSGITRQFQNCTEIALLCNLKIVRTLALIAGKLEELQKTTLNHSREAMSSFGAPL